MRTSEVYELECWACDSHLVIGVEETCCPDCGAEFVIEWRPNGVRRVNLADRRRKEKLMITMQNYRVNLDQIAYVEIGDEVLKLNGPGAGAIILDKSSDAAIDLLLNLESERFGWMYANGKLINPKHIVSMTKTEEGHLKVYVNGIEIFVPDEEERATLWPPSTSGATADSEPAAA